MQMDIDRYMHAVQRSWSLYIRCKTWNMFLEQAKYGSDASYPDGYMDKCMKHIKYKTWYSPKQAGTCVSCEAVAAFSFRYWTINTYSLVIWVNQSKLNHTKKRFLTHLSMTGILIKINDPSNNDS